jgi:hypothetical protein
VTRVREGGCACGVVRYRMQGAPIVTHACHCRFCQRMSGSAFGLNAMIEADRLLLLGEAPEVVPTPSALPEGQKHHRCRHCRVALWSNHSKLGDRLALVAVGTLVTAEGVAPDVHCFTASKHPWVVLPPGVPAFEGDYDAEAVWSPDARRRIAAAMADGA